MRAAAARAQPEPKANVAHGPAADHSTPPSELASSVVTPPSVACRPMAEARSLSGVARLISALLVPSVAAI